MNAAIQNSSHNHYYKPNSEAVRILPTCLPTLAMRLNQEMARYSTSNNPPTEQEDHALVAEAFESLAVAVVEETPKQSIEKENDAQGSKEARSSAMKATADQQHTSSDTSLAAKQDAKKTEPVRRRVYSISDTDAPAPLIAPPPSPIMMEATPSSDVSDSDLA